MFSHSAVHCGGEIEHEVLFAFERYALREIAGNRSLDQTIDFALDRLLDGLIAPFHDRAGTLAVRINDRGGHQMEFLAADRDVGFVRTGERIQQSALMGGVLMEHVHIGADQLAGVEVRQHLAQLGLGLLHHLLQGRVHVHDVVVAVGDHHVRLDHVEAGAHPQIDHLLRDRLLEHLGRLGDLANLVATIGIRHVDDAVVGQLD